jgi:4-hydroxy-tetrahydrodipicolinate reductase
MTNSYKGLKKIYNAVKCIGRNNQKGWFSCGVKRCTFAGFKTFKIVKIALIGYGKMGKMIEQVALQRGHHISCVISSAATMEDWAALAGADVAIEFSKPDVAVENIMKCFDADVPVAVGTTGWYGQLEMIRERCQRENRSIITATNFSIGVNLFFHINKIMAQVMESLPEYDVAIEEIHHTQKLDAPSGTAITLAQGILSELSRKKDWKLKGGSNSDSDLSITAIRKDDVPGTHAVTYSSATDDIEIKHTAHNRSGFAMGAVIAAEWLRNKRGFFTMNDLIGF